MGSLIPDQLWPPDLLPGAEEWLEAFWELSTDRQFGMTCGPIPAASIARHTAGWDSTEAEAFRRVIRAMDGEYLKHAAAEKPKASPEKTLGPEKFGALFG